MRIRLLPLQLITPLLLGIGLMALPAEAQSRGFQELSDGNSKVRFSLDTFGFSEWLVDGVNYLPSVTSPRYGPIGDLYFLNIGSDVDRPESFLSSFQLNSLEQRSERSLSAYLSGFDGAIDFQYDMELEGGKGGSSFSRRYETITLFNRSDSAQQVSLFSYSDFDLVDLPEDLEASSANDSILIEGNQLKQSDASGLKASVTADQTPDFVQADVYPRLIMDLVDGNRTTLNGNRSIQQDDVSGAFQFNRLLQPGDYVVFRFLKQIGEPEKPQEIPEPVSAIAIATTAGFALFLKRKKAT